MKTKIYYLICSIALLTLMLNSIAQKNIMFVGRDPATNIGGSYPEDKELIDTLEANGYTITYVYNDDFKAGYTSSSDYEGCDAIYLSETLDSKACGGFKAAGYPLPCVTTECWVFVSTNDRWGWLSSDDQLGQVSTDNLDATSLKITDNTHYITEPFTLNQEMKWSNAADATTLSEVHPIGIDFKNDVSGAVALANCKHSELEGKPMLWAIPDGTTPANHTEALANRLVMFGVISPGLRNNATEEFFTIIKRALIWVLKEDGGDEEPIGIKDINMVLSDICVSPNPVISEAMLNFSLQKPAVASLVIYDITGRQITSIDPQYFNAGRNHININSSDFEAGIYIYNLSTTEGTFSGKINVLK